MCKANHAAERRYARCEITVRAGGRRRRRSRPSHYVRLQRCCQPGRAQNTPRARPGCQFNLPSVTRNSAGPKETLFKSDYPLINQKMKCCSVDCQGSSSPLTSGFIGHYKHWCCITHCINCETCPDHNKPLCCPLKPQREAHLKCRDSGNVGSQSSSEKIDWIRFHPIYLFLPQSTFCCISVTICVSTIVRLLCCCHTYQTTAAENISTPLYLPTLTTLFLYIYII